jgi:heme-degrading monooxygenase HmoA
MTVLVRMSAAGMETSNYDEASAQLAELVKKQPGFMMHVSYKTADGMGVGEVWESREQYDKWFNENVKPNVPFDIKQEFIEVHNVIQP